MCSGYINWYIQVDLESSFDANVSTLSFEFSFYDKPG